VTAYTKGRSVCATVRPFVCLVAAGLRGEGLDGMTTSGSVTTQAYLTERRAEQYRTLGTEAVLAVHAGDWTRPEALINLAEGREREAARTAAERHGIRQVYTW